MSPETMRYNIRSLRDLGLSWHEISLRAGFWIANETARGDVPTERALRIFRAVRRLGATEAERATRSQPFPGVMCR